MVVVVAEVTHQDMTNSFESVAEESQVEEVGEPPAKRLKTDIEEEEVDDERKLREKVKDFIDDAPTEESDGEDSNMSERSKKENSDDDFDDRLDDEDYDLIEENLGVKVERKRFRHILEIQDEESEEEQDVKNERERIAKELFDTSDNEEERASEKGHHPEAEHADEEDSDSSDFIVSDDGLPIANRREKRKPIYTDLSLQEALDIFGVDFDYGVLEAVDEDGYEEEKEEEGEYLDEEGQDVERRSRPKKTARKKTTRKSIFEIYEPSELKRRHFTDLDIEIRNTDIPERMQLRDFPVTAVPEGSDELDEESEWIHKQAFCKPTISNQVHFNIVQDGHGRAHAQNQARKGPHTILKIKNALDLMRNQNFEVPFIAFYRKECIQPELNINDLWRVYRFDEKWCQLRTQKMNLIALFEKMRDYQAEQLMKEPDKPIPGSVRLLMDEDIDRLRAVQTPEELGDVRTHFMLYYSDEVPEMQKAWLAKECGAARKIRRKHKVNAGREEGGDGEQPEGDDEENETGKVEDEHPENETVKRAFRSGPYSICRKAGLGGLAKKFGLTPEQFGENLQDNYQRHGVEQEPAEPMEVAMEYISNKFTTGEEVLKSAKFMVAMQLSRDPLVKKCVREKFFGCAKLNIKPTKKGMKEIDENHPCYSMKYVKNKPVRDLTGDEYLKLTFAEADELLTVSIIEIIDGITSPSYIEEVKQLYYRDECSKNVEEWNSLRAETVELALTHLLLPELRKELQIHLLAEAREAVLKTCRRKLYNWLKVAPYSVEFANEDTEEWDTGKGLRVMAVAYVPDYSQAAFACIVAPNGDCTHYLRLPHLLKRKYTYREEERLQKEADILAMRNFITAMKPHVICVSGESKEALMVAADLREIIRQLVEDEQFPSISVEICDNELAKIYSASVKNEFRGYPQLLRQAISLARRMQDPLIEFSQLCTSDEEILCLRYHTLQEQVPREELLEALYLEFVNRTNEVGVDINLAVLRSNTSNLLQFVCGLGPRKGQALLKILKQNNQRVENRMQLVTACHMRPKVFMNCAGFIKIDTKSLGDSTETYIEVLDGSRVHPETYEWASRMAIDALGHDYENANPVEALEKILEVPESLKDLDLDAFAKKLEKQGFSNKSITLYDIRTELNHQYKDLRSQYTSPNPEELFDMLTKENHETLIGKMVLATVTGITHRRLQGDQLDRAHPVRNDETGLWQCLVCMKNNFPELCEVWKHLDDGDCPGQATGIRLQLDNGISGYIHIRNLSDKYVRNPEERVARGQTIHCRVTRIDVERFSVECTSKTSDLVDKNHKWRPPKDPFYDDDAEEKDRKAEENAKKVKQHHTYVKRVIVHPSFHNITFKEAEWLMDQMDQGEVVVRPSSKGSDHLSVMWKVTDGICQHIDVREENKKDAFSLGQSLWIGNEQFEDLDEIIARYVNPMAGHARDLLSFKYYRDTQGLKDKAEEIIMEEKKKNASKIHYMLSASKSYPGRFLLSYLPRTRFLHEYITVTPEGFRFRQKTFGSVGSLFQWFKENFSQSIPEAASSLRGRETNRTPYNGTPNVNLTGMNPDAIKCVAQAFPSHMLNSQSQVASQAPHYLHTCLPGGGGYGTNVHTHPNTLHTPFGQTPFLTQYHTPHATQTPWYGQQTPSHCPAHHAEGFVHPGSVTPSHRTSTHRIVHVPHTSQSRYM